MQAKDISDEEITRVITAIRTERNMWTSRWDLEERLPQYPPKVILAKCRSMLRRGLITGCPCGCRGNFEIVSEMNAELPLKVRKPW